MAGDQPAIFLPTNHTNLRESFSDFSFVEIRAIRGQHLPPSP